MKKIALVTMFVALKGENGLDRFEYLAEYLANSGYTVDLITTSFQHWDKKPRKKKKQDYKKLNYNIVYLDELGYKKNVSLKRFFSHHILAKNLKNYLIKHNDYDLVYTSIPPNNTAYIASKFAKENDIPLIVDVEDLWPEAMKMIIDIPILSDLLFYSFKRDAERVYNLCDGIIGTSDEYRDRPLKNNKRKNVLKDTVYVGNKLSRFDKGVTDFYNKIEKNKKEFWVAYAGTIGSSYDIKTLILASKILKDKGYENIKVKIMGGGPMKDELETLSNKINCNVEFLGYVQYEKMAAYLSKSDIVINSFVKKAPQSIVTKIGDYLASGKPMINTCSSKEFKKKVKNDGFGINIEAENPKILASTIEKLYKNPKICKKMGVNARKIAENEFDRPVAYKKIVNMIEKLI